MKHRLKSGQYATLLAVVLTASFGDALLSRGMAQVGPVDLQHLPLLYHALFNANVVVGILLLICFFASYMTALSWADLTFVMPATAFGNVVIALLSRFLLHEHLSLSRWIGILLVTSAVGFVADRPARTDLTADMCEGDPIPASGATMSSTEVGQPVEVSRSSIRESETLPVTRSGVGL